MPAPAEDTPPEPPLAPATIEVLVANHREFLGFVESKVGDRALAEDILQQAFVRGLDKLDELEQGQSAVAWFYRVLRNSVIDHYRRRAASGRKLEAFATELEHTSSAAEETRASICQCVARLAATLKDEYAQALRRVELDGVSVQEFAREAGISSNNAAVRVFRARDALRKRLARSCGTCAEHGCLDCTCAPGEAGGAQVSGAGGRSPPKSG